jgi:drug/metabolite transporter (DMT)-like permease
MLSKKASLGLLVLTALLWSSSGILVKSVEWPPLAIASIRGLIAGIFLILVRYKGLSRKGLCRAHFLSGLCMASLSVCFIAAMKLTAAANVVALQYTAPVWVAVLAPWLLKERVSGLDWAFMLLIFGGIVLFFMGGLSSQGFWGNVLALASGLFFALQALCLRSLKANGPATALIIGNFMTFLVGLPAVGLPLPDLTGLLCLLSLGLFQFGLAYHIYALAVPRVTSLELVMVTMLEPILSPVWVFLFLGEKPGSFALAGGLAVVLSVTSWGVLKSRQS